MLAAKELGMDTHPMDGFDHDGMVDEFETVLEFFMNPKSCHDTEAETEPT